jgi:hypothetical protein
LHHFVESIDTHVYVDGKANYFSGNIFETGFEYELETNYKLNKESTVYADIKHICNGSIIRT